MSEQIDWSKAPEDATHYLPGDDDNHECWLKSGFAVRLYRNSHDWFDDFSTHRKIEEGLAIPRPTAPSWSGEGLPPVGVVCEGRIRNSGNANDWFECEVLAHHKNLSHCAGVLSSDENELLWCSEFRRVRTPEQIEADEREAAIGRMCKISAAPHMLRRHAEALYDAGYRKP